MFAYALGNLEFKSLESQALNIKCAKAPVLECRGICKHLRYRIKMLLPLHICIPIFTIRIFHDLNN